MKTLNALFAFLLSLSLFPTCAMAQTVIETELAAQPATSSIPVDSSITVSEPESIDMEIDGEPMFVEVSSMSDANGETLWREMRLTHSPDPWQSVSLAWPMSIVLDTALLTITAPDVAEELPSIIEGADASELPPSDDMEPRTVLASVERTAPDPSAPVLPDASRSDGSTQMAVAQSDFEPMAQSRPSLMPELRQPIEKTEEINALTAGIPAVPGLTDTATAPAPQLPRSRHAYSQEDLAKIAQERAREKAEKVFWTVACFVLGVILIGIYTYPALTRYFPKFYYTRLVPWNRKRKRKWKSFRDARKGEKRQGLRPRTAPEPP